MQDVVAHSQSPSLSVVYLWGSGEDRAPSHGASWTAGPVPAEKSCLATRSWGSPHQGPPTPPGQGPGEAAPSPQLAAVSDEPPRQPSLLTGPYPGDGGPSQPSQEHVTANHRTVRHRTTWPSPRERPRPPATTQGSSLHPTLRCMSSFGCPPLSSCLCLGLRPRAPSRPAPCLPLGLGLTSGSVPSAGIQVGILPPCGLVDSVASFWPLAS